MCGLLFQDYFASFEYWTWRTRKRQALDEVPSLTSCCFCGVPFPVTSRPSTSPKDNTCTRGSHVAVLVAFTSVTIDNLVSFGYGCISCPGQYFVNTALRAIRHARPSFGELFRREHSARIYIIDPQAHCLFGDWTMPKRFWVSTHCFRCNRFITKASTVNIGIKTGIS